MLEHPELPDFATAEELISCLLREMPQALACIDTGGQIQYRNRQFQVLVRESGQDPAEDRLSALFPSIDAGRWARLYELLEADTPVVSNELLGQDARTATAVELRLQHLQSVGHGLVMLTLRPERAQAQGEQIHLLQNEVLQAIASGKTLFSSMDLLCRRVEVLAPEVLCTVLLVDDEGRVHPCAAPSLPAAFGAAIDGEPIGPKAGSCGTAAWRGEPVEVTDIANDPLWEDYRPLALPLGLAACWSSPIKLRDGSVAGTFALYFRTPRGTNRFHRQMIQACVHLCALAIEHEQAQARIHQLAFYDGLTGLPNASLLRDRAQYTLEAAHRDGESVAVLFFDLDHFKTVNESLGHDSGDALLRAAAQRLRRCLEPGDTLTRIGGDEFLLLVHDCGEARARMVAGELLESLAQPFLVGDRELSLSASIGISLAPADGDDFETLHKNADMAMYQAKGAGRNTFRFYQSQMNESAQQRLNLAAALRRALAAQALSVHYQPKIALDTMRLVGLEALVRWQDPELGWVSPATFIPLAEEIGLIGAVDLYVLEQACRQIVSWRERGLMVPSVAVNLSAADFRGENIVERIEALLGATGCKGELLTLEITESLMLGSVDDTLAMMHRLRRLGIALAVDDFGTGFSSLSYLKRFPVTELKIDQSFVADLEEDANDRALAEAVIQLGESFDLQVVAEGVETAEQLEILRQLGCGVVQGYHLARPMSAEALEAWFDAEGRGYLGR